MLFPLMQQVVILFLGFAMLDGGQCFQIVGYAALGYWGGFALIMARRHGRLTTTDRVLIRWGYLILCFIISPFITGMIWSMRGYQ